MGFWAARHLPTRKSTPEEFYFWISLVFAFFGLIAVDKFHLIVCGWALCRMLRFSFDSPPFPHVKSLILLDIWQINRTPFGVVCSSLEFSAQTNEIKHRRKKKTTRREVNKFEAFPSCVSQDRSIDFSGLTLMSWCVHFVMENRRNGKKGWCHYEDWWGKWTFSRVVAQCLLNSSSTEGRK
jgi:hypothetical protein